MSVLKELLLQFIISLLPVFAYQIWYDKDRGNKDISVIMTLLGGSAMALCMITSRSLHGYDLDLRLIPYTIASLYGGLPTLIALTVAYVTIRIPMLDNWQEAVIFGVFIICFILLMVVAIRPFQRSSALRKKRLGLILMGIICAYYSISLIVYFSLQQVHLNAMFLLLLAISIIVTLSAMWLSLYMIESVREKRLLYEEVTRVSANYRNEVEKLQQFIGETSFAVLLLDREGSITHINELAIKLFGLKPEYGGVKSMLGQSYRDIFPQESETVCRELLHSALNGKREMLQPYMEGDKMLLKTVFAIRSSVDHQIVGAALIAHDVTELTQLRNEVGRMERLSLVGQMAASITHEIRNPMAVIRGFVQLIQERSESAQHDYFRIVMEELDRVNMIISDFLSLAQNRALTMEMGSLNDIIADMRPLLEADANLRGQTLLLELCEEMPPIMVNDREIKQLLLNLARNGMEAMDEKGILTIATVFEGGAIELRIADVGVGIPQEKMNKLFEPFFTTKTRGTGLGLPLCLSIAERHNGRIDAYSTEGEGTTFVVTFNVHMQEVRLAT
ncbi:PAS domain S-box-containing protein [Paenibacillus harenae]|uniref:histidine kinase n=1 Tax=Paenibacillus harenae TaxID=306543 RepID=A0ABT9TXD3_PAEHA|nr:PAS domain S-box-containing protein [Paenibacillus harenae]